MSKIKTTFHAVVWDASFVDRHVMRTSVDIPEVLIKNDDSQQLTREQLGEELLQSFERAMQAHLDTINKYRAAIEMPLQDKLPWGVKS